MIWVDREVKKIKESSNSNQWVDDMKTPSGRVHVGALRGVLIHDLMYKVLLENKISANFSYVFNDNDPMDAIPSYLDFSKWEKYAGMPLYKIPSPDNKAKSFARFYAEEFIKVFNSINCHPQIIWASELYENGKMNKVIKTILDSAPKIREIYKTVSKAVKSDNWFPFNVICENCGRIGTTYVYKWDGKLVHYRCQPQMVAWAKGCGHEGKISPFNGNGKLPWKLDWPSLWKVIGITIEGAGKDHMSSGGSHDFAKMICEEVLDYNTPYALPYEWFTIGGRKMSSSKGVGASASDVVKILPPEVFRFLIVRTPIETALDFNPFGDTILNIFDDYDRCLNAYFVKKEKKLPEGKPGEVMSDFARIIELSEVRALPKKRLTIPRFRTIVNLLKAKTDIENFFRKQKKSDLNKEEKNILKERIKYAKIYLKDYSLEKVDESHTNKTRFELTKNQIIFFEELVRSLEKAETQDRDKNQEIIFGIIKENNLKAKEVFKAFYRVLIGKDFGPKAADLITELGFEKIRQKFRLFRGQKT